VRSTVVITGKRPIFLLGRFSSRPMWAYYILHHRPAAHPVGDLAAGESSSMTGIVLAIMCAGAAPGPGPDAPKIGSYLYRPAYATDYDLRLPAAPYSPQPGDIFFSTDGSRFWKIMHNLAGTGHPTHCGVAFRRPDGTMAIIEAGPHDTMRINSLDAIPHLASYEDEGRVWIRRRAVPLTQEQSDRLTEFALAQEDKRFAIIRLGQQLTPLRPRGPIKTIFLGKPSGPEQSSFYCAELAMESLVYAGLLDPKTTRPSCTYPRDFFMDKSLNPYINKHLKLYPCWDPPARWTSCPIELPK
jgi:hypothetical protein